MSTPNLAIEYVPEDTLDPAAGLNTVLTVLDAIVQSAVISMALTAPPGFPGDGDLYIVAGTATGDWAGEEDNLARYVADGTYWIFYTAGEQINYVLNQADGGFYKFYGSGGWALAAGLDDAPTDGLTYVRRSGAWESVPSPVVLSAASNVDATATNAGNYTRFSHAAPTYTFDDAESYEVGAEYHGRYIGAGTLTITPTSGMTVNAPYGGTLEIPPDGTFTVKIVAADEADLIGITVPTS